MNPDRDAAYGRSLGFRRTARISSCDHETSNGVDTAHVHLPRAFLACLK